MDTIIDADFSIIDANFPSLTKSFFYYSLNINSLVHFFIFLLLEVKLYIYLIFLYYFLFGTFYLLRCFNFLEILYFLNSPYIFRETHFFFLRALTLFFLYKMTLPFLFSIFSPRFYLLFIISYFVYLILLLWFFFHSVKYLKIFNSEWRNCFTCLLYFVVNFLERIFINGNAFPSPHPHSFSL